MKNPFSFFSRKKEEKGMTAHAGSAVKNRQEAVERPGRQPRIKKPIKPDPYYGKLAAASLVAQYIVLFTLILFAAGMPFLFSDEITIENFGLLLRNISFSFPGEQVEFTSVRYDADLSMDFAAYKEYFAVATTGGVRLYDHRGHIALDEALNMTDPVLDAGERYVLAYDREGKEFAVYNSISLLYTGKEESSIHCADLCDEGSFLILTGSSTARSVIKVYNRAFNLQRELRIDRYPLSATLSSEGETLLFLSCDTNEAGELQGYVNLYDLKDKTVAVLELCHQGIPLYGVALKDGAIVVFEDGVYFYDKEEGERLVYSFDQGAPFRIASSKEVLAVVFEENGVTGRYRVEMLSTADGGSLGALLYEGRVRDLFVCARTVWLADDDKATVFDPESGTTTEHGGERPMKIVCSESGTVFACYANKAETRGRVHIDTPEGETEKETVALPSTDEKRSEEDGDHGNTEEPAEESANGKKVSEE